MRIFIKNVIWILPETFSLFAYLDWGFNNIYSYEKYAGF